MKQRRRLTWSPTAVTSFGRTSGVGSKATILEAAGVGCSRGDGLPDPTATQGADAGVDIIAGRGQMGFDPPRLCVQVKSGTDPIDVKVLHELQGVMKNFGAEQGLLVSWGGFKGSVISEARKLYFNVRLWTADELVNAILDNYERLPDTLQAELPLKRIWTLVQEED